MKVRTFSLWEKLPSECEADEGLRPLKLSNCNPSPAACGGTLSHRERVS